MLVLTDTWVVFEADPMNNLPRETKTIYEVEFVYKGTTKRGFEFKVRADVYKNVPLSCDITNNLYQSRDGVVHLVAPKRTIYLSQAEVEQMYRNTHDFYVHYIMNSETCYVQTIKSGGAGSEHI